MICEWCGGKKVKQHKQGPYLHFICQNGSCRHEWDVAVNFRRTMPPSTRVHQDKKKEKEKKECRRWKYNG